MNRPAEAIPCKATVKETDAAIADPVRAKVKHIAFFMPSLAGGGAERSMLNLARALADRGCRIDLVVCKAEGAFRDQVPLGIKLVELEPEPSLRGRLRVLPADPTGFTTLLRPVLLPLKASTKLRYLHDLTRYLRREHPDVLLSAITSPNLVALWARHLARVRTRVVISERNTLSQKVYESSKRRKWRWRFLPSLVHRTYPWADAIVAVSEGVARDLSAIADIPQDRIQTIYNAVVTPDLEEKAKSSPEHPWLTPGNIPVILGAGRLVDAKDFQTLVYAFARVRKTREARLVILGEGSPTKRAELESLAHRLGLGGDISFPGWVPNPYAYMAHARVFVLSSLFEGLPRVLIEAMACGCPVVSTDCPSGPGEILEGGKYGALVPVGDREAMGHAIQSALDMPLDSDRLKARASEFSVERSTQRYLTVLCGPYAQA